MNPSNRKRKRVSSHVPNSRRAKKDGIDMAVGKVLVIQSIDFGLE